MKGLFSGNYEEDVSSEINFARIQKFKKLLYSEAIDMSAIENVPEAFEKEEEIVGQNNGIGLMKSY